MAGCSTKHMKLKEIGQENLIELRNKKVFLIGVGGLGSPILEYLSRFYLKQITIVDFDVIETSNLERQILFGIKDVGKNKIDVAYEKLKDFCKIIKFKARFEDIENNMEMKKCFEESDIIIDGVDNNCTKKEIFNFCKKYKKTLVSGSVVGTKGYTFITNFSKENNLEDIYNKVYDDANESGVFSASVMIVANVMISICIKALLNKQQTDIMYNVDGWNLYLDEFKF